MLGKNTITDEIIDNDKSENRETLEDVTKYPGKWYVINCYSGHEDRVRDDLIQRVESLNMKDVVFDIRVVKETVSAKKGGKLIEKEKNVYPSYIFINMISLLFLFFLIIKNKFIKKIILFKGIKTSHISKTFMLYSWYYFTYCFFFT